ncbi:MAG: cation-translocating P-type ATPase, partial [Armatimonadota bacterium]
MQELKLTSWHALPKEEVLARLNSSPVGLSKEDAEARLSVYGENRLPEEKRISPIIGFLNQFRSPLIYILLVATILSFASGHPTDGTVILVVVLLNAVIGFLQEFRAENTIAALKQLSAPKATVLRDDEEAEIDASGLVPGDLFLLEAGDKVPADGRLIEEANLKVDEAALTGESVPSGKMVEPLPIEASLADRRNMVYSGTTVSYGRGVAVVTASGSATEIGRIAAQVAAEPRALTPVQRKLARLAGQLGLVGLAIAGILIVAGIVADLRLFDVFFIGVAAAVSFIPEGLPAVITIVLAVGVQRMARNCAVIRKLPAVETLGSATVICTDKTGTLTKNEMTVVTGYTPETRFTVTGEGYIPEGRFDSDGESITGESSPDVEALFTALVLCSDARLHMEGDKWKIIGDPTEGALVVAGQKLGLRKHDLEKSQPRVGEVPFDSESRYMATLNRLPDNRGVIYVKGAPEQVLAMCDRYLVGERPQALDKDILAEFTARNEEMAEGALRVLAAAYREVSPEAEIGEELNGGLIFLGAVGMIDPPREEAKEAIRVARAAGIRTIMVTGDHPDTARAIAERLGLLGADMRVVSGRIVNEMSDEELATAIERIAVFARAEPEHKYRIEKALRSRRHVVGMTGDGVNDAPALRLADIGISMGITGTDVAK